MLKIKDSQLDALRGVVIEDFHARLFRFARAELSPFVASMSDEALRARIAEDHEAAKRFGLQSFRAVTEFVGLSLTGGPRKFYEEPAVVQLFSAPSEDPELVMSALLQSVKNITGQEAAREASWQSQSR